MLEKDHERRYQSVKEIISDLNAYLNGTQLSGHGFAQKKVRLPVPDSIDSIAVLPITNTRSDPENLFHLNQNIKPSV
jgi:hypothetical protein